MLKRFECLTTAAGKHNFRSGEFIELPTKDAKDLLKVGAIRAVDSEKPVTKAKKQ